MSRYWVPQPGDLGYFYALMYWMCRNMFFQKYEASKSTLFIFFNLELPPGFPSLSLSLIPVTPCPDPIFFGGGP